MRPLLLLYRSVNEARLERTASSDDEIHAVPIEQLLLFGTPTKRTLGPRLDDGVAARYTMRPVGGIELCSSPGQDRREDARIKSQRTTRQRACKTIRKLSTDTSLTRHARQEDWDFSSRTAASHSQAACQSVSWPRRERTKFPSQAAQSIRSCWLIRVSKCGMVVVAGLSSWVEISRARNIQEYLQRSYFCSTQCVA